MGGMRKKIIVIAAVVSVLLAGGGVYWWLGVDRADDRSRVDLPIAEQVGEVEPVLEVVAEELGQIWALDFIPGTTQLLATENSGRLYVVDTESLQVTQISGVPTVSTGGQGGLLDVAVSPEFADDRTIYLTYSAANNSGDTTTHLARAELNLDSGSLDNVAVLYAAEPFLSGANHYGSRVVVDGQHLYLTIGDRGDKNFDDHVSQDTSNVLGTTVRLLRDGSIPPDNPFVDDPGVLDEIYSYGHRNAQGMAIHPQTGELWQSEHGERDGDEINRIQTGGNYGWPIATTGCTYITRATIGDRPEDRPDTVNPMHYWECGTGGFPPAGMAFYDTGGFVDWQGDLFVGGLASQYLAHFRVTDNGLEELEPLLADEGWRVRDVIVGQHDGAIYAAVEGRDISIVRIVPKPVAAQ